MRKNNEILANPKVWGVVPLTVGGNMFFGGYVKLPDCGTCAVVYGYNEAGKEHVSVSPRKKSRMPSWDDMCALKDIFFEDEEEAYEIHPPKSGYVNLQENCLHLWRPVDGRRL